MPDRPPRFSVILPVHNGEAYIAATIESVVAQTYPHFRLLILENASTDQTRAIIDRYADERISVIPAPRLLSIEENWGRILDLDLDEYGTFISHDDLIYPTFLQAITGLIAAEPQASLYHTSYHLIDGTGRVLRDALPGARKEDVHEFMASVHSFQREIASVGYVARSADYKKVGGLPSFAGLLYADTVCWYRLTALAYKAYLPTPLAAFRLHAQSATRSSVLVTYYEASRQYLEAVAQLADSQQELTQAAAHAAKAFQLKRRQIVADLIRSYTVARWQDYEREKENLAAAVARNPVFNPADRYAALLERIAQVPSDALRKLLLNGLQTGVKLARALKRRASA